MCVFLAFRVGFSEGRGRVILAPKGDVVHRKDTPSGHYPVHRRRRCRRQKSSVTGHADMSAAPGSAPSAAATPSAPTTDPAWDAAKFLALPRLVTQKTVAHAVLQHLHLPQAALQECLDLSAGRLQDLVCRFWTRESKGGGPGGGEPAYYLQRCRAWVIDGLEVEDGRHDELIRQVKAMPEGDDSDGRYDDARAKVESCLRAHAELKRFDLLDLTMKRRVVRIILEHLRMPTEVSRSLLRLRLTGGEVDHSHWAELLDRFWTMSRESIGGEPAPYIRWCRWWVISTFEWSGDEEGTQAVQMPEAADSDGAYEAARASVEACLQASTPGTSASPRKRTSRMMQATTNSATACAHHRHQLPSQLQSSRLQLRRSPPLHSTDSTDSRPSRS